MDTSTVTDLDVANMARWGILFQDSPEWFNGHWSPGEHAKGNIWNYIDFFGERQETADPLRGWTGGDTPIFWTLWNEYTISPDNPYLPVKAEPYEPLADWEWELLGDYGTIFESLNRQYDHIMGY